uniref:Calponin-homology (CH) domain-containing protein n=1 Tax=Denticeps clupeoides TaxID=299321 RepID=A0AAY4D590_9TELE
CEIPLSASRCRHSPHVGLRSAGGGKCAGPLQACPAGAGSGSSPPWSRGLERALEEAASSGYLNLSTRKLKEFPRSASNYDLTDTVHADLSKNRLTDVPSEVCHLVSLETLSLYHNCIKTVPDTLINLQSLTNLNLSRNLLCVLPPCVCSLPLRILNVSNNRLNSLPESLGQLSSLMELDISCNEITSLPRHIGRLRALRELNVRRNLLCVLPDDLVDLPLVKFDFSCNKVSTIPTCYRKMFRLQSLQFENNPLQSPPAQICMKGRVHIFKYLMQEVCRGEKMADILYLPVNPSFIISRPSTGSTEDFEQSRKQDSDSGVGSDSGDKRLSATEVRCVCVCAKGEHMPHTSFGCPPFGLKPRSVFLRAHKHLDSADPQFTMRRRMEQLREEMELIEQLRENIESRLKVSLPEDLGSCLMDGVVLCHLANHIRPRCIASIHVPSPAVPKLSMAKCRRNVENFLDACRKMGVSEEKLCLPHHILEQKCLAKLCVTVQALLGLNLLKGGQ